LRPSQGLAPLLGRWRVKAPGSDEAVSLDREVGVKQIPAIQASDQTTVFDHVGIRPDPDLPAFL
jgi:hypothetical protein